MVNPYSERMPVVFVGHGSPMNAIEDNHWSRAFKTLGESLPKPKAIVSVSAHWLTRGTFVTANEKPKTIHDFGGFPKELFEVEYPARGDVDLAARISELLDRGPDSLRSDWGLDHGTWSVLVHTHPDADVPVVQVSIDVQAPLETHLNVGKNLASLRDRGVLILASGNITHNLRAAEWGTSPSGSASTDWAQAFDQDIATSLEQHDHRFLFDGLATDEGRSSHPTIDHYLPLLYAAGASSEEDTVTFPITGFDMGTLSMRAVQFG